MIHFTADTHFNHENILKMCGRPFETIGEHDEHLIEQIKWHVRPNDSLWIVGDVAWHSVEQVCKRIGRKNVYLIWGNHDRPNFGKHFGTTADTAEIKISHSNGNGPEHHLFLSHYAHAYWPGSHKGWFHLYGHTHAMREETLDAIWPERRSMDVGVDNAKRLLGEYRPFTADEIIDILGSRVGHDPVAFYQQWSGAHAPR